MVHPDPLELDQQLCFALYSASRAVIRAYGPLLAEIGLTYPQYVAMLALWEHHAPVTVGELGRRLHLESGTITPLLKRLEQLGVVERHRDVADERRVMVGVTAAGRQLRSRAAEIPRRLATRHGFDPAAARTLHDQLVGIVEALDAVPGAPDRSRVRRQ